MILRRTLLQATPTLLGAPALLGLASLPARAQAAFPSKPIRYIVPVAPGGGSDFVGRTVTERWGQVLKQTFVVENQSGGGGTIACQTTARAAPDGYTLMQGYVATHGTSPATRKLPYDAVKDFTPVGMIGGTPNVLVVNASVPAGNLKEFVAYLKANPGRLSYGSAGPGSLTHLTMELFKQQVSSFIVHIPYRGIAPAFTDLIGGQTQAMFPGLAAAVPHIRSGRVRPLAVTGLARHPLFKDLPTLDESGYKGFDAQQWYGVVGPAGIAEPIVRQLNETLNAALGASDLREKLSIEALEPNPMSAAKFGEFLRADIERWTKLAKERNIQLDS
ncbi:MAG: tripartite tricarboxylate transporter substrate binding protein [Rubrivivax sp.]|nr:tripartite tricarboxylate transporter substrate binding protein [Rubrivivax sp.]